MAISEGLIFPRRRAGSILQYLGQNHDDQALGSAAPGCSAPPNQQSFGWQEWDTHLLGLILETEYQVRQKCG